MCFLSFTAYGQPEPDSQLLGELWTLMGPLRLQGSLRIQHPHALHDQSPTSMAVQGQGEPSTVNNSMWEVENCLFCTAWACTTIPGNYILNLSVNYVATPGLLKRRVVALSSISIFNHKEHPCRFTVTQLTKAIDQWMINSFPRSLC